MSPRSQLHPAQASGNGPRAESPSPCNGRYCSHLAAWAELAGPVSDGLVLRCLQECWAGAPWQHAAFHLQQPGAAHLGLGYW